MKELSKTHNPEEIEQKLYDWWDKEGYFTPEKQLEAGIIKEGGPRFCITLPPPNVTGALHLGHAIVAALEDLMARYYRMKGFQTLFLPGTDHAGIATQNVVERELRKQGIDKKDLGRKKFIEKVWEWKSVYHGRITKQSRCLGMSCDWSRERFTLDSDLSYAVRTAFVHLYKKGLIYRGAYLVNWCPRCESAISDLESIPEEHNGHLWYISYPIINDKWKGPENPWGSGKWAEGAEDFIQVATTRPETLLGDTGVATIKSHEKFGSFIGKKAALPATGREIPVITDEMVDSSFGTGAVKITPAHDPNDYEAGMRHKLESISVMDEKGKMNELAGPYKGLDRFECRKKIVEDLKKEGLLVKIEPYNHSIGHCERCHTIVEPRISTQWFMKMKPLAEKAIEAVSSGETTIIPEREEKRFFHWMENIRDWCISRQLWWGHTIPVWYCGDCDEMTCEIEDPKACSHCKSKNITQDEDVLDTWFSSGLWPFSTLGWPKKTEDLERYYPTDMRETAYDILFFWVAREMMFGIELTGKSPYKTVYLHGLVRNEDGKKISKSMENIDEYDPINLIAKTGTDAIRYTLVTSSTPGLDTNLDFRRLEGSKRFCNKIWQASRFVLGNVKERVKPLEEVKKEDLTVPDRWILSKLNKTLGNVKNLFDNYQYGEGGRQIYDFFWSDFCDWYIEASKVRLYDEKITEKPLPVLLYVLESSLRLLHPLIPYVTEELWQALPETVKSGPALIVAKWPEAVLELIDEKAEGDFEQVKDLIGGIRRIRTEYEVDVTKRISVHIAGEDKTSLLENLKEELIFLARLDPEKLVIKEKLTPPQKSVTVVGSKIVAYLPLESLVNLEQEIKRLEKKLENVRKDIEKIRKKLAGDFSKKAPPHIVEKEKERLLELEGEEKQIEIRLKTLN